MVAPTLRASGRGRPARRFAFRPDAGAVLGVDIAHDASRVVLADLNGTEVAHGTTQMSGEPGRDERIAATRELIASVLRHAGIGPDQVGAVAIATPGSVDDRGAVDTELSMRGWRGVRLGDELGPDFACPVEVENDAKLAVRAELREGVTRNADHVLWLLLEGRYNGMGIVVNGTPYRGVDGTAGEIFWAKQLGLDELWTSPLIGLGRLQSPREREAARAIVAGAEAGDVAALAEVDRFAAILARGLSTLSWVLAPRFVVLGGSLTAGFGELLVARVTALFADSGPPFVEIRRSSLGEAAALRGAVSAALERFDWTTSTAIPPTVS